MCARQPITQTPPALTGLTETTHRRNPLPDARAALAARSYARVRRAKVVRCLLGALDRAQQSALSTSPWGTGTSGPRGTVRGRSDIGCSVNYSSKCGLSAFGEGLTQNLSVSHPPRLAGFDPITTGRFSGDP